MIYKAFVALSSADGYKKLISNVGKDPQEPSLRLMSHAVGLHGVNI